jgi:4,5-dihydroxyphthalate decarboxylase
MPAVQLSAALTTNERTRFLLDGSVVPDGVDLVLSTSSPGDIFWRQLKFGEFDVSEMSISSFAIATSQGPTPWVGLPVFTMREFFHTHILVRDDAGIATPADLRGKRVGVMEYQQTSVIWIRGILQHEFGVAPHEMEWFMERTPAKSHGGSTGFTPPPGVRFSYIPPESSMAEMIHRNELDAILFYPETSRDVIDSKATKLDRSRVRTLFADPIAEGHRYYAKTGIFPINHCVIVRRSVAERYPWVALNLYSAFMAAKARIAEQCAVALEPYVTAGFVDRSVTPALGADPLAYGIKATRPAIETIAAYLHEQGLTKRVVGVEELFVKNTMDL